MGAIYTGETSKKKLEELEQKIESEVANLLEDGKIKTSLLPSYVDDMIEGYFNDNKFYSTRSGSAGSYTYSGEITGESGKIYLDVATNTQYRFGGSVFTNITSGVINDNSEGTATTYSSQKINTLIANKTEIDDTANSSTKTLSSQKIKSDFQTKSITDTGNYFSTDTVEGALQEIGAELSGLATLLGGI